MSELVSPKQVAHAIGVSESSLKRWCDQGLIQTVRTAGGHRRLSISAVLNYLRQSGYQLLAPESLGLPPLTPGAGSRSMEKARVALLASLRTGDELSTKQIVTEAFLARHPVHVISDELIAPTFHEIGRLWGCGDVAVYQERQACEIMARVLLDLRRMMPIADSNAPKALGGTLEDDHYSLPNSLAELVVRESGWNAASLGTHLPAESLSDAVRRQRPQLVWLSISHFACEEKFIANIGMVRDAAHAVRAKFVIGGRVLCESLRERLMDTSICNSMKQLDSVARNCLLAWGATGDSLSS